MPKKIYKIVAALHRIGKNPSKGIERKEKKE